jgi:hypothetical protein
VARTCSGQACERFHEDLRLALRTSHTRGFVVRVGEEANAGQKANGGAVGAQRDGVHRTAS